MTKITTPDDSATGYSVRLAALLPKSHGANGLADVAAELVDNPGQLRFGLIAFEVSRIITDVETNTDTAVVKILRVEMPGGGLATTVQNLLLEAVKGRTGNEQPTLDGLDDDEGHEGEDAGDD